MSRCNLQNYSHPRRRDWNGFQLLRVVKLVATSEAHNVLRIILHVKLAEAVSVVAVKLEHCLIAESIVLDKRSKKRS